MIIVIDNNFHNEISNKSQKILKYIIEISLNFRFYIM
jgi:hypothetical protein